MPDDLSPEEIVLRHDELRAEALAPFLAVLEAANLAEMRDRVQALYEAVAAVAASPVAFPGGQPASLERAQRALTLVQQQLLAAEQLFSQVCPASDPDPDPEPEA